MATSKKTVNTFPVHPGDILSEELVARNLSIETFAKNIGLSISELNEYLHRRNPFSESFATRVEQALDIPSSFWMGLQGEYDALYPQKRIIYSAMDIAGKVVASTNTRLGDSITNLKLQKLLYFLQGYFVVKTGYPLFQEEICAWEYGPVVPEVYKEYRIFGSESLPVCNEEVTLSLEEKEEVLFNEVYDKYNSFSASSLVRITHKQAPWKDHYDPKDKNAVIPIDEMQSFFWYLINHPEVVSEQD